MSKKHNLAMTLGMIIIAFFILVAVFAPYISPYDPDEMGTAYLKPDRKHLLGTNDVGQDILSELIYGTRVSLFIGIAAAIIITGFGTFMALCAGYFGGIADKVITAVTNIAMALPSLPLTMLLIAFIGGGTWSIILSLCITAWAGISRVLRVRVQQVSCQPFVNIERALGVSSPVILIKHIMPNILDMVLMRGSLSIASAMLTETSLSFLGLGTYGEKSWGNILHYAFFRNGVLSGSYWWYLPPIICICLAVLGFMLFGYYGNQRN